MFKIKMITALSSLILLTACGEAAPPAAPEPPAKIGQPIKVDDLLITVTKVSTRERVGIEYAYEKAGEGGVLVVIQTTVKNVGAKPASAFSLPDVKLVDPAGVEYASDGGKTSAYQMEDKDLNAKLMSDLNPDISMNDAEVFEVSKSKYDPATWSVLVGKAKVSLAE